MTTLEMAAYDALVAIEDLVGLTPVPRQLAFRALQVAGRASTELETVRGLAHRALGHGGMRI
jgi:hypothetical protein